MLYRFLKALVKGFCHIIFRIQIVGEENIPNNGPCFLCANHKSYWDPVILIVTNRRKVHFMAKSELFRFPVLRNILNLAGVIPLHRGKADLAAMKKAMEVLKRGDVLGMFPAGTRTKEMDLSDAKAGAALIAARTGTMVVPVGIHTTYRLFSKIVINIGAPMDFSKYKGQKTDGKTLEMLSDSIYEQIMTLAERGNAPCK